MKFSKLSQLFLVSMIGLLVATLLTACQLVTIDFVFVATSAGNGTGSAGQIETYAVDSTSGAIRKAVPIVSSGGTGPVAMAITSDYYNLYVANQGNNSVVHFTVASSGVLTNADTITANGTPVSVAVSASNQYLYVITGTSSATLTEYSLSSGKIGAIVAQVPLTLSSYPGDAMVPTAVTVLPNSNAVYVTAYDQSAYNPGGSLTSGNPAPGWVFAYTVGSGGTLTAAVGSPYQAGVKPAGVVADPTNRFVYVTDFANNHLIGYSIQSTTSGKLSLLPNSPFNTGNEPTAIAIDPRGLYIYLTNSLDSTVSGYSIALQTGTPSTMANSSSTTDTEPVAIAVDPATGRFVFTANKLGNSVSGFHLNPDNGTLTATQATPYPTGYGPSALVIVPHGNHATQAVAP
jgi:6-phosphogluconolactonase (cycloisomerase 2 family)